MAFYDMLSMGVCTTRHRHESGKLMQEIYACAARVRLPLLIHIVDMILSINQDNLEDCNVNLEPLFRMKTTMR